MGENRIPGKPEAKLPACVVAERHVSRLLADLLSEGYLVLNDIPFKYGNIDHAVIRPDGTIFLLETKSHKGTVTTDGKRILINAKPLKTNPIGQVMRSIRWIKDLAKRLSGKNPWIVAVLVFPNARVIIKRSVKRVNVLPADRLIEFIRTYAR